MTARQGIPSLGRSGFLAAYSPIRKGTKPRRPASLMLLSPTAEFLLRTLALTGAATLKQLANGPTPVSSRWVVEFTAATGLTQVITTQHRGRRLRYVVLTQTGRRAVRERTGLTPYVTRATQAVHDCTLTGYYLRLPDHLRAAWRNPQALMAETAASLHADLSFPDGLYLDEAGAVAVEVAGAKLTGAQVERKRRTARELWGTERLVLVEAGRYADDDF